jgi:hypothetical protein
MDVYQVVVKQGDEAHKLKRSADELRKPERRICR